MNTRNEAIKRSMRKYKKENSMKDSEKVATGCVVFTVVMAFIVGLFFAAAWVFMVLWNVCVTQAIDGTNEIGYWIAMGLMVFFGAFIGGARAAVSGKKS